MTTIANLNWGMYPATQESMKQLLEAKKAALHMRQAVLWTAIIGGYMAAVLWSMERGFKGSMLLLYFAAGLFLERRNKRLPFLRTLEAEIQVLTVALRDETLRQGTASKSAGV